MKTKKKHHYKEYNNTHPKIHLQKHQSFFTKDCEI